MKLKPFLLGLPLLLLPQVASAEILSVKTATANFRENPHEAAKVKFTADQFYPVEVVERKSGWAKVKDFEGDEAWVAEKTLGKTATIVITADRANVRDEPTTSSEVLFKVERGEVFKIEERSRSGWMKVVDARGDGGWVRADMTWGDPSLEPKESSAPTDAEKAKALEAKPDEKKADDKPSLEEKKAEPKVEAAAPSRAKEAETKATKPEPTDKPEKTAAAITQPENLEALCRAYLDQPQKSELPKSASTSHPAGKPASKPAAKPAAKPASKPAAKPQPPKADKKK